MVSIFSVLFKRWLLVLTGQLSWPSGTGVGVGVGGVLRLMLLGFQTVNTGNEEEKEIRLHSKTQFLSTGVGNTLHFS